jgi:hypothetical protein
MDDGDDGASSGEAAAAAEEEEAEEEEESTEEEEGSKMAKRLRALPREEGSGEGRGEEGGRATAAAAVGAGATEAATEAAREAATEAAAEAATKAGGGVAEAALCTRSAEGPSERHRLMTDAIGDLEHVKMVIADFVGVRRGEALQTLHRAARNMGIPID